jgi:hypothetical protein
MADDKDDAQKAVPATGGTRSGAVNGDHLTEEVERWGAAEDDDAHHGLGADASLTPDEAAEVLFGDEAEEVRSFKHDEEQ